MSYLFFDRTSMRRTRACTVAADAIMASRDEHLFARRQPPIRRYLTRHSYSIQCEMENSHDPDIDGKPASLPIGHLCTTLLCSYYNIFFPVLQSHAHIFHKGFFDKAG